LANLVTKVDAPADVDASKSDKKKAAAPNAAKVKKAGAPKAAKTATKKKAAK
jgi:hypothetical protein